MSINKLGFLATSILLTTGGAALIYEVAWQRHLTILVGVDHAATAMTLAVFLGGLSLGYALCGRISERVVRPLRVYAGLEIAIGVWGLSFPWIFAAIELLTRSWSFSRPFGLIAGTLGAAIPLVLIPALLMGATVPFMTRGLAMSLDGLTGTHARVYGLNTLGAVGGALVAGFVLLPRWGPNHSVRLAAMLNLAAAAVLLLLSSRIRGETTSLEVQTQERPARERLPARSLIALALLSGAATMAQENALIRLLGLVLGGTATVFCLIVSVFIAAIAIGSLVVAKRSSIPPRSLWVACSLSCAAWLALFVTYDDWPWLAHLLRFGPTAGGLGFASYHMLVWVGLAAALLVPVAPMGAVLPLVFHEQRVSIAAAGRVSGRLLAWNALGALLGSIAGGVLLFHVVDLSRVLLVAPLLTAAMAWLAAPAAGRVARPLTLVLAGATMFATIFLPGFDSERIVMGTYRLRTLVPAALAGPREFHAMQMINRRIVHHEDDSLASTAVIEVPAWDLPLPRPLSIYINGKSDSNTLTDRETLRLSAHLPMLFAAGIDRALVIGQGTGVTAGELTLWPELRSIDVVEVSPAVARSLPLFRDHTHDVGDDPRVRVHVQDVRHFLRRPGRSWDVIVSEPSNLWVGGNDLLFTIEFFRSLEARLADGGVLLQWIHLYETDSESLCSVMATLGAVFPHASAFRGTQNDWLIVASRDALEGADDRALARLTAHPQVQASLAELQIDGLADLLARRIRSFPPYLDRARSACPIHTSIDTRLAYRAARDLFDRTVLQEFDLLGSPAPGTGR